ncbi:ABC transporter permease [Brevibacillus sp. SYSU BS000544]|uniref:ABC transporter permease n=1 Tax=Brevibacillus sp. SYSU BS000544 TaxID=3416443 RepID=UPI003CE565A4
MNLLESFRIAIDGIWANKMRSGLTMLGIIIGITSVIAVNTLGEGGQQAIVKEIEKFGASSFNVIVDWNSKEEYKNQDLTIEDTEILTKASSFIEKMVPLNYGNADIQGPKKSERTHIIATGADYLDIQSNIRLVKGRFLSRDDDIEKRSVVVLDAQTAKALFKNQNPVGKRVRMYNTSVVVIGVVQEDKFRFDMSQSGTAYIPIRFHQTFMEEPYVSSFLGKASSKETVDQASQQTKNYLNRKHGHKDHYMVRSLQQEVSQFNQMTDMLTLVFSVIAGISLFVGGIGVMNIMLVSVTERTREIGIRKALGAQRRDILIQFLIESVIVCLIGGAVGVLLGIGLAAIIAKFANLPPFLAWDSVFLAFGFSSAIGIFFGLYPANKAAKLDPIEALRYE